MYLDCYPDDAVGFVSIDSCSLSRKYYTGWELALLKHTKGMYLSIPWKLLEVWGAHGTARSEYGRTVMYRMLADYERREYCELADHGFRILAEAVEAKPAYHIPCPVLLLCGQVRRRRLGQTLQPGVDAAGWISADLGAGCGTQFQYG